jgi:hypothetical protein
MKMLRWTMIAAFGALTTAGATAPLFDAERTPPVVVEVATTSTEPETVPAAVPAPEETPPGEVVVADTSAVTDTSIIEAAADDVTTTD